MGANWKKIEQNALCTIDTGCIYMGYVSDINTTWVVGKATQAQEKVASDMARVQELMINSIKPGASISGVQSLGANALKDAGYTTDRTKWPTKEQGQCALPVHGLGLGPMHDLPYYDGGGVTSYESGMAIAVQISARLPDFSVGFEDNAIVVPGGLEVINKLIPRHL